jgi:hypothetical protein
MYGTEDDAMWEESDKLSDDDLGHPGPNDECKTILADKIKSCLVFSEIKMNQLLDV